MEGQTSWARYEYCPGLADRRGGGGGGERGEGGGGGGGGRKEGGRREEGEGGGGEREGDEGEVKKRSGHASFFQLKDIGDTLWQREPLKRSSEDRAMSEVRSSSPMVKPTNA